MVVDINMDLERNKIVSQLQKDFVVIQERIYDLTGSDVLDALLDLLNGYLEGWYIIPEEEKKK